MEGELHSTNDETSSNEESNILGKRKFKVTQEPIISKRQKVDFISKESSIKNSATSSNSDENSENIYSRIFPQFDKEYIAQISKKRDTKVQDK